MNIGLDKSTVNLIKYTAGFLLLAGGGYYVYRKIKKKADVNRTVKDIEKNPTKKLSINIPEIATQIGMDLGYFYPSYDPRHWTENDQAVVESVLKVPKTLIPVLISEYYKKYKRNLKEDLQSKLDEYSKVSYLFT